MTKVGQLFEKEKIEYSNQNLKRQTKEYVKRMLSKGMDIIDVKEITGLTEEVLSIQDEELIMYKD